MSLVIVFRALSSLFVTIVLYSLGQWCFLIDTSIMELTKTSQKKQDLAQDILQPRCCQCWGCRRTLLHSSSRTSPSVNKRTSFYFSGLDLIDKVEVCCILPTQLYGLLHKSDPGGKAVRNSHCISYMKLRFSAFRKCKQQELLNFLSAKPISLQGNVVQICIPQYFAKWGHTSYCYCLVKTCPEDDNISLCHQLAESSIKSILKRRLLSSVSLSLTRYKQQPILDQSHNCIIRAPR